MRKLKDLKPCDYKQRAKEHGTLRKHWEDASAKDLMWLLTHEASKLPRRRLIGITLKTLVVCEHVMPEASKACLLDLQRWVDGEEVDLKAVYAAAYAAARAASATAYATDATDAYAYAYARAASATAYATDATDAAVAAAYATRDAAYAAADAASYAAAANYAAYTARVADYDAASQKQAEIIREAISFEEACSYLDLDPEEVLT